MQYEFESIQPILNWISNHPTWAGIAVFFISLSESLAIVGLVVPGVVMMTAIGAMMGSGVLPFWETLLWAILGAIAGDGISYWLGYHYHEHLRDFWPFKQFPGLLKRGEKFFEHHGGKSIIFGRFVGPVRPMIPVIAGMMDMSPKRFLLFNILSAIAWAPLYSLPGILIGASLGTMSPEVARRILLLILLLLFVLWIIYVVLLKLGIWFGSKISHLLAKTWHKWQRSNQLPWLHKMLSTAQGTEEGQLGAAVLFIIPLIAFIIITLNVMNSDGITLWNEPVYQVFRALYNETMVDAATFITGLGDRVVLLPTAFVVGVWFWWRGYKTAAYCWLITIGIAEGFGYLLKDIVAMPRPDGIMQLTHEYSYPSGHVLSAVLIYGLAAAFIQHTVLASHRWIAWAIAIPLMLLVSLSRLYLGAHWFTDVLGSIMLGIAAASMGILIFRRIEKRTPPLKTILMPSLIMLTLTMIFYTVQLYPKNRAHMVRQWPVYQLNVTEWWQDQSDKFELHRTGAFKRGATYFNIQWLGQLESIKSTLKELRFSPVTELNFQSGLNLLSSQPTAMNIPVMPKFHRDRLPVLVVTKPINDTTRLLIQLWHSDYVSEDGLPLWLGTMRIEELTHPVPLVSLYMEDGEDNNHAPVVQQLIESLKNIKGINYRIHPSFNSPTQILFIRNS